MSTFTLQQAETLIAALQARNSALQTQVDDLDTRVAALVENVNELRGDRQRVEARRHEQERGRRGNGPRFQAPVADASAKRQSADDAERQRRVSAGLPATLDA